jgi:hypothetical protein
VKAASLLLAGALATSALPFDRCGAALVIDQQHDVGAYDLPFGTSATGTMQNVPAWQTFTSALTGKLARVDLGLYALLTSPTGPLTVEITETAQGKPDLTAAGLLASRTVHPQDVPVSLHPELGALDEYFSVSVDFAAAQLDVSPGQQLAIVLRSLSGRPEYFWWTNPPGHIDGYTRGAMDPSTATFWDAQFRTVVDVVPEPVSSLLAGIACLTLSLAHRGRIPPRLRLSRAPSQRAPLK